MHDVVERGWTMLLPGLSLVRRGREPIRHIQVYGQRCSGTHAIIRLIEANFGDGVFTEAYGFKHWFVPMQTLFREDALVLVIARDPFEWAQALHRQPWHAHADLRSLGFSDFIRSEWHSVWDAEFWGVDEHHPLHGREMVHERDPQTGRRFANAIAKRTAKLAHWSGLSDRAHNIALLGRTLVRDDPEAVIASLSDATGLRRARPFVPIETYKGHGVRRYSPTAYPPIDTGDRAHIRRWLDPTVEERFGFAV